MLKAEITKIKNWMLVAKGIDVTDVVEHKSVLYLFSNVGVSPILVDRFTMHLLDERFAGFTTELYFHYSVKRIKGWERTLNIDFSMITSLIFYKCNVNEEFLEKYVKNWDLSSCATFKINNKQKTLPLHIFSQFKNFSPRIFNLNFK